MVPGIGGMRLCLLSELGVAGELGDMASMLPKVEARLVEPIDGERFASGRGIGGGTPLEVSVDCLVGARERSSSDSSPSVGSTCVSIGGGGGGTGRPGIMLDSSRSDDSIDDSLSGTGGAGTGRAVGTG